VEPYRILFPVGAIFAIVGVALWPALALGFGLWPGELHARLMAQGFELAFIGGFLLTFLPPVTRTIEIVRPLDTGLVVACVLVFGAAAWMNAPVVAQAALVPGPAVLVATFADPPRRGQNGPPEAGFLNPAGAAPTFRAALARRWNRPPETGCFIPSGLLLGLVGGAM